MTKLIDRASELVPSDGAAVVVYTNGTNLVVRADGSGEISRMKIDLGASIRKMVIYRRAKKGSKVTNTVFLGDVRGMGEADERGRRSIGLSHVTEVGTTASNWFQFAEGSSNPVRYVRRAEKKAGS